MSLSTYQNTCDEISNLEWQLEQRTREKFIRDELIALGWTPPGHTPTSEQLTAGITAYRDMARLHGSLGEKLTMAFRTMIATKANRLS